MRFPIRSVILMVKNLCARNWYSNYRTLKVISFFIISSVVLSQYFPLRGNALSFEINVSNATIQHDSIVDCTFADTCEDLDLGSALTPETDGAPICIRTCNQSASTEFVDCSGTEASVWVAILTDDLTTTLVVTLDGNHFTPQITSYIGTDCSDVMQVNGMVNCERELPAAVGTGGNQMVFFNIASEEGGELGDFDFCVRAESNLFDCYKGFIEVTRPEYPEADSTGPYFQGETVHFCVDIEFTIASAPAPDGNNCQWLQGIVPVIRNGWDLEFNPLESQEPPSPASGGRVQWLPEGVVDYNFTNPNYGIISLPDGSLGIAYDNGEGMPFETGTVLPAGWWFTSNGGLDCTNDGDPDTMFGDGPAGCDGKLNYEFCFELTTKILEVDECNDPDLSDLTVEIYVFSDGETGCWMDLSCALSTPLRFDGQLKCDSTNIGSEEDILCEDWVIDKVHAEGMIGCYYPSVTPCAGVGVDLYRYQDDFYIFDNRACPDGSKFELYTPEGEKIGTCSYIFDGENFVYDDCGDYNYVYENAELVKECITASQLPCNETPPWELSDCNLGQPQSIFLDRLNADRLFASDIAGDELTNADWIGVFFTDADSNLVCQSATRYPGPDKIRSLTVCQDDPSTPEKDGFDIDEPFVFKIWRGDQENADVQWEFYDIGEFEQNLPSSYDSFEGGFKQSYLRSVKRKVTVGEADCDDPIEIGCEIINGLTNATGRPSSVDVFCSSDNYVGGSEVFLQFTNEELQDVKIKVFNMEQDLELYLLDANCDQFRCLAQSETQETEEEILILKWLPAGDYYIAVDGYIDAASSFDIEVVCGDFLADTIDDAIYPDDDNDPPTETCPKQLICGSTTMCTTVGLNNNFCSYGCTPNRYNAGAEKVFTFTHDENQWVFVNLEMETGINLDLFLFNETSPEIDCYKSSTSDGDSPEGFYFWAIANKDYYIIVDGYDENQGEFTLTITGCIEPSDDGDSDPPIAIDCSSLEEVMCNTPIQGSNANGTDVYSYWGDCGGSNNTGQEVMYIFNNPEPQQIILELTDLQQNLNLYLLDGCNPNNCIGQGGTKGLDRDNTQSEVVIYPVLPAGEYIIVIDGVEEAVSSFTLNIDCEKTVFDCLDIPLCVNDSKSLNLISTCYLPADRSIESIFNRYEGVIKSVSDDGGLAWTIGDPNCPFDEWNDLDAYNVVVHESISKDTFVSMCGILVDSTAIKTIVGYDETDSIGKNLIGYPFNYEKPVLEAIDTTDDNMNILYHYSECSTEMHTFGDIESELNMKPGRGYILVANADGEFNYRFDNFIDNGCEHFRMKWYNSGVLSHYRFSAEILSQIAVNIGDELAVVNTDGEVISSHRFDGNTFTIAVEGDSGQSTYLEGFEENDTMQFKLWSHDTQSELMIDCFLANEILNTYRYGYHYDIDRVEISKPSPTNDEISNTSYTIYPNPFDDYVVIYGNFRHDDKVEIYTLNGQVLTQIVTEKQDNIKIDFKSIDDKSSMLILNIVTSKGSISKKIVRIRGK